MPGFSVRIEVDDGAARRSLQGIAERAEDLSAPLHAGGLHMLRSIRETFRVGGRPARWAPLAPATLKAKAPQTTLLIGTGRLLSSITFRAGRRELAVGTSLIYGRIHQLGGRAGRGHAATIPARPYLVFQSASGGDVEVIARLVGEHMIGGP